MAGPKRNLPAEILANERRIKAVEMKRAGHTYDEIAQAVGYASRSGVHQALKSALEISRQEMFHDVEAYRVESIERYEALLKAVWTKAREGDLKAVAEARRLVGAIADITGAKAPVQIELGETDIDRLLAGLDQVLNGRAAAHPAEVVEGQVVDDPAEDDREG